jgi:hypothetical protein
METNDLELVSTRELVEELMRRQTWVGLIIQSDAEADRPITSHKNFELAWKNMNEEQVCSLLEDTLSKFGRRIA